MRPPDASPGFRIVCEICEGLGIVFDGTEDAPATTQIRCRQPRGTLGELRDLSSSGQHDQFEI